MNGNAPLGQAMPRMRAELPQIKVSREPWETSQRRFKDARPLGSGSFGAAYSAKLNGRSVIIKRAKAMPGIVSEHEAFQALRHEMLILGKLQKFPFIPRLVEIGPDYFVQEDVGGEAMLQVLARKGMEARELLAAIIATGTIVSTLHRAGVAHGDLEPRNLLLTPQGVVVIDFGISVEKSRDASEFREALKDDVVSLLDQLSLAASAKDIPPSAKAVLLGIFKKFHRKVQEGRLNEKTGGELAKELFFVTAQLGARHERDRKLKPEKIKVVIA
jgi:serine/threonine protein kinase